MQHPIHNSVMVLVGLKMTHFVTVGVQLRNLMRRPYKPFIIAHKVFEIKQCVAIWDISSAKSSFQILRSKLLVQFHATKTCKYLQKLL